MIEHDRIRETDALIAGVVFRPVAAAAEVMSAVVPDPDILAAAAQKSVSVKGATEADFEIAK